MEILNVTNTASAKAQVEKSIGSIVLMSTREFANFDTEKIRLFVERNGNNNIEITKGAVSLKKFVLCATYGDDAIGSMTIGNDVFKTCAVIELCEHGGIALRSNDKIKIELSDLSTSEKYLIDGIEEPVESSEIYTYEEKILATDNKVIDVNVKSFDTIVLDDLAEVSEIQYHYDNGQTCNYTSRELRALAQDVDPISHVKSNGTVVGSFTGVLQLPLKGVDKITVKKTANVVVNILMRHDEDLKLLN